MVRLHHRLALSMRSLTAFLFQAEKMRGSIFGSWVDSPLWEISHRKMVYRGGCGSRLADERASPSVTMIGSRLA
jgi:hypothetical protein